MSFTYTPFFLPGFGGSVSGVGSNPTDPTTVVHPTTWVALAACAAHPTTITVHPTTVPGQAAYATTVNALAATHATTINALAGYGTHYTTVAYKTPMSPVPGDDASNAQFAALAADANLRQANGHATTVVSELLSVNLESGKQSVGQYLVHGPVANVPFHYENANLYIVFSPTTIIQNVAVWPESMQAPARTTIAPPVLANVSRPTYFQPTTVAVPNQVILFSGQVATGGDVEGVVTPTTIVEPAWVMGGNAQPTTIQYYQAVNLGAAPFIAFTGSAAPQQGSNDEGTV